MIRQIILSHTAFRLVHAAPPESSFTTAGKRSFAASTVLLKPQAGNFTVLCSVFDSFFATSKAVQQLDVLPAPPITEETSVVLKGDIQKASDEGNGDGSSQMVGSIAETMNADATSPDTSSSRMLSEFDKAGFREELMDFVVAADGASSNDPYATKQRVDVVKALSNSPEEQTEGSLDKGSQLIDKCSRALQCNRW